VTTTYAHDAIERLTALSHDLSGSSADVVFARPSYNAAGQAQSRDVSNNLYMFAPLPLYPNTYSRNPLDQYTQIAGQTPSYDTRGNLTFDGANSFTYDVNNRLTSAPGGTTLAYDPLSRLQQITVSGTSTRLLYDGADLIAEFDSSGNLQRRYVHGPGLDEPLVWYEGGGTSDRRWMLQDDIGSVVATTDAGGGLLSGNTYDEYGVPAPANQGRFQYTGQVWLASAGVYHYKARTYAPRIGRFLQTDPVGYAAGSNLYAYVSNDPVGRTDPSGLEDVLSAGCASYWCVEVTGEKSGWSGGFGGEPGASRVDINGEIAGVGVDLKEAKEKDEDDDEEEFEIDAQCPGAAALGLHGRYGPFHYGRPEYGAIMVLDGGTWRSATLLQGSVDRVGMSASIPSGASYFVWHSHTLDNYYSFTDVTDDLHKPGNFMGGYLSGPGGLYGPPWRRAGTLPGTSIPYYRGRRVRGC
jgi:RHS repeat-associated protein